MDISDIETVSHSLLLCRLVVKRCRKASRHADHLSAVRFYDHQRQEITVYAFQNVNMTMQIESSEVHKAPKTGPPVGRYKCG